MRATRIPADEQYRLIKECRASGLTDYNLFPKTETEKTVEFE